MPAPQTVIELRLGDLISLRKAHACGGRTWLIDRLGADIGLVCQTCRRRVLLERRQVERRLAGFEARGPAAEPADARPAGAEPAAATGGETMAGG